MMMHDFEHDCQISDFRDFKIGAGPRGTGTFFFSK